jgi:hypothetical protein
MTLSNLDTPGRSWGICLVLSKAAPCGCRVNAPPVNLQATYWRPAKRSLFILGI